MMYGPYGLADKKSPCMVDGKCLKHFLKRYNSRTSLDEDGYPKYRRRNDGFVREKKMVFLLIINSSFHTNSLLLKKISSSHQCQILQSTMVNKVSI